MAQLDSVGQQSVEVAHAVDVAERYQIHRVLRQQSMASPTQLWLVKDCLAAQHAPKVVIKYLAADAAPDQQNYFHNEIKTLMQLRQSRLIQADLAQSTPYMMLLDHGWIKGDQQLKKGHYYVMPYYMAGDFAQYLSTGQLSHADIQHYFLQLLGCVAALHAQGYLHLDLKPANFLLSATQGERYQLLLTDFALATPLHTLPQIAWGGTPRYMSPEQFRQTALSVQSDFYALGIMLFDMLSQHSAYHAKTYRGWAAQHCQQPIPLLPPAWAHCQPVVDGLLAKNSQLRFKDVLHIEQAFLTAMASDPELRSHSHWQ